MDSCETLIHFFKKKVVILGGYENYKDEFQKRISLTSLPIENKHSIGVNISKIDFLFTSDQKFEFLLWNIDCGQNRAFLRSTFYSGADAIIIFISENKIEQIKQYFEEIQLRVPEVTLIFCVILEKCSNKDIINFFFKERDISLIIEQNRGQINEIKEPAEIFRQLSSIFVEKIINKEIENQLIIDFIPLTSLFGHSLIRDECNDYFLPETTPIVSEPNANVELLSDYIHKLDLGIDFGSSNWININNEFGLFSIYLKNGKVFYYPTVCKDCKYKHCPKFKKAPYFICIEAEASEGWTNIRGFTPLELLILAKIIALKEGNATSLPKSVITQIRNINICEKKGK
ncbi:MAG: hypothetical protein ACFFEN_12805 [Candidatus Thorarchaeota archaeon]